jgi:hypothetical protein
LDEHAADHPLTEPKVVPSAPTMAPATPVVPEERAALMAPSSEQAQPSPDDATQVDETPRTDDAASLDDASLPRPAQPGEARVTDAEVPVDDNAVAGHGGATRIDHLPPAGEGNPAHQPSGEYAAAADDVVEGTTAEDNREGATEIRRTPPSPDDDEDLTQPIPLERPPHDPNGD